MKDSLKKKINLATVSLFTLGTLSFSAPALAAPTGGSLLPDEGFAQPAIEDAFLPPVSLPKDISDTAADPYYTWAYQDIVDMLSLKAMKGYPDGTFRPDQAITRGELAQAISGALYLPKAKIVDLPDVSKDYWAAQAISNALPYLATYPDGSFRPESPATREEVAVALVKATGQEKSLVSPSSLDVIFTDAKSVSSDLKGLVATAVDKKLIKGYTKADEKGTYVAASEMTDSYGDTIAADGKYSLNIRAQDFLTRAELANSLNNARENSTLGYKTLNK